MTEANSVIELNCCDSPGQQDEKQSSRHISFVGKIYYLGAEKLSRQSALTRLLLLVNCNLDTTVNARKDEKCGLQ